jgi:hypothetical protein
MTLSSRTWRVRFRRDGDDGEFYPRGKNPIPFTAAGSRDGWPGFNIDAATLIDAMERFIQKLLNMPMDSASALQIHGVLVARHGLMLEEYFSEHRNKPQTRSFEV